MSDLLIQFALSVSGRIVAADEVPGGLACRCHCIECGNPLVARQGKVLRPHFAHLSSAGQCNSSGEGIMHKLAKRCLTESVGKVIVLGTGAYYALLRGVRCEVPILTANRVVDTLAAVEFRFRGNDASRRVNLQKSQVVGQYDIAVEVSVTHAKDEYYCLDMQQSGTSVFEKSVSPGTVYELAEERNVNLMSVMKQLLLSSISGTWLSVAGLPEEIVFSINSYNGLPSYLLDKGAAALKAGDRQAAKHWITVGGVGLWKSQEWAISDRNRWREGAKLIAARDPKKEHVRSVCNTRAPNASSALAAITTLNK